LARFTRAVGEAARPASYNESPRESYVKGHRSRSVVALPHPRRFQSQRFTLKDEWPAIESLIHALSQQAGAVPIGQLIEEYAATLEGLERFDPLRLAATFSGLLTLPELQSNCIRLEALVHICLTIGNGHRKPSDNLIAKLFSDFGEGRVGSQEDPAEDVFVSLIRSPRGNFRVLGGTWEAAGFCLQRIVNALERVPENAPFDYLRDVMYALLKLSDAVCARAKLTHHELGNEEPEESLPGSLVNTLSSIRRTVRFHERELKALGISLSHLAEFGFDPSTRGALRGEMIGDSTIERFPVGHRNGEFVLFLPTAVSVAIRRFLIEKMAELGLLDTFAQTLAYEYARLFAETPLLGGRSGAPVEFRKTDDALLAGAMTAADRGLYINFVFFADTLEAFDRRGMMGSYPVGESTKLDALIEIWIDEAYNHAIKEPDFRQCLTVLVGCGVGRAISIAAPQKHRDNWRLEFIGAPDLVTLSWLRDFKALSLWRLLDSRERLEQLGTTLQNINGLVNMVGWARSLGGHLVPHGDLPSEFGQKGVPTFVMVRQNALRNVRHEVAAHWNLHVTPDVDGKWIKVMRDGYSLFAEDDQLPFYVAEDKYAGERWPRGVYETEKRSWWMQLVTTEDTDGQWSFQRMMMLRTWIRRMAPVLERAIPGLPEGALLWRVKFTGKIGDGERSGERTFLTFDVARATLSSSTSEDGRTLAIVATPQFEEAIFHPENVAERALVWQSVDGFARLAETALSDEEAHAVVDEIVQGASARQAHGFMVRAFRDHVRASMWTNPIAIDTDDSALLKLGLGWRARSMEEGGDIRGRENCTAYLNSIVRTLEDEVCNDLRQLDRRSVIMFALNNHEAAINDRDSWRRTASAVLALHSDKGATLRTMAEHDFELNAIFQASRLIIEFAICECPMSGARKAGRLDMSRLMAKVLMIAGMGGWSAAIHWEAMEPRIQIAPLGDIHANVSFQQEVLAPYARAGSDLQVEDAVKNYDMNLELPVVRETDGYEFPKVFWEALEEECGAPLEATRRFLDVIEDAGIARGRAIFVMKKAELLELAAKENGIGLEAGTRFIEFLTFKTRPNWREVPTGYDERERFPWRFRRRLTILRKPLIQLDDSSGPDIIVTPGIARDAFAYMVGNYHRGDFPRWQLQPKMRTWAGRSRDRIGRAFSEAVAARMRELGWNSETEVPVTKLLRKGFDRNYGDVDVLAWNETRGRVLLMECKDVQHRKIEGEIAEQLADFRGALRRDGKPDDLLKHLRRVEVIMSHAAEVARYVGFERPAIEGHLVFRNPVPMKFAQERMEAKIAIHLLSELDAI
jgi:hypothetical protein